MRRLVEGAVAGLASMGFSLGADASKSVAAIQRCLDAFCVANDIEPGIARVLVNVVTPYHEPSICIAVDP